MSLVQYGVSAELIAVLDGLRETPGISGPKYRQKDIDNLSQMILCRNYGKATLELSYLLQAILMCKGGGQCTTQNVWLNFFWLEEAITPKRFRAAFDVIPESVQPYLQLKEQGLTIHLPACEFTLSPTRVATLASLLEFLVYVDPAVLQQDTLFDHANEFDQGTGFQPSKYESAVKTLASDLQKILYRYLADHLQPAQQQRRFRYLWAWLSENHTSQEQEGAFAINDAVILAFWKQATEDTDDSLGFRRYRTVAENFFDLRIAIQSVEAQQRVSHSMDIELPPEILQQVLTTSDVDCLDVNGLTRTPKFLSKQQAEICQPIVEVGDTASVMALTIMRMRCFGDWQASLVQALRNKSNEHLRALLSEENQVLTYSSYIEEIKRLQQIIEQSSDSVFHILLHCEVPEVFGLVLQRLADVDLNKVRGILSINSDDAIQELSSERISESHMASSHAVQVIVSQWPELLLQVPTLNHLIKQFQKAFKANNRQGFKSLSAHMDCEPYMEGAQLLDCVLQRCKKHLYRLNEKNDAEYASDLSIFKSGFISLYGDYL